ncbi:MULTISPECIES: HD-GYP domain-containing protein [Bacillaceae]|uniref:HD-GYP domain-containing protein n=1 Tax=Evansella alkalicola TaxID=745819 RepID=A0ABS6JZM8_9BACI|nr:MULTISPECIES: HD-GYP domain-containing protein [Bacillaceae]MBU9722550.1 HD-GYP domain-containing protein [Bacillus alkalicola]
MSYILMEPEENLVGKVLGDDVVSDSGHFLLRKGMTLTTWHLQIIKNHQVKFVPILDQTPPLDLQISNIFRKKEELSQLYSANITSIKQLFQQSISNEVPSLQHFMKEYSPLLEKVIKGSSIFLELYHIKGFDEYTYRHSINVGLLSATIGRILNYPIETTIELGKIGFFHDIGKMKISNKIIQKEGPLTDEEFEEVKKHTIYGKEIIEQMDGADTVIQVAALYHHERLDGSGYPFGLEGDAIPMVAQIISVADAYDAITSDRVYREKYPPFHAIEELVNDVYRGKLNGNIVFPFVHHIVEGYVGNEITLSDGRRGTIIKLHYEELSRPLIIIDGEYLDLRIERSLSILDVMP